MPRDNEGSEVVAALAPEPVRRRGRPPGSPRTPGSGRKPGKPNKTTAELRDLILSRGRPLELLCAVAAGRKVKVGAKVYAYPNLAERAAAARILMERVLPAPKVEDDAGAPDVTLDTLAARSGSDPRIELARRAMFMLTQGARAMDEQSDPYASRAPSVEPPEPEPAADTAKNGQYADTAPEPVPEPAPEPKPAWRYNPLIHGRSAIIDD